MSQDHVREFMQKSLSPSRQLARAHLPESKKTTFDQNVDRAIEDLTQLFLAPRPRGPVVSIDNLI